MAIRLPHNLEAEQQILGAILTDDRLLLDVSEIVEPEDFYSDDHRAIYEIAMRLRDQGKPANVIQITDAIGRDTKLRIDAEYLTRLEDGLIDPRKGAAINYSQQVANHAQVRASMKAHLDALDMLGKIGPADPVAEIIDQAETLVFEAGRARQDQGIWLPDAMDQLIRQIDADQNSGIMSRGLSWSLPEIDEIVGRMLPGRQVFLGGIPGSGKTSLGMQALLAQDKPTVMYSLEMSDEDHAMRRFSHDPLLTTHKLETRQLNNREIERMAEILYEDRGRYKSKGVKLRTGRLTIAQIKAHARREKHINDICAICIDHLRIVAKSDRKMQEYEHAAEVTYEGKELAKELGIPVIMLGQLKRPEGARADVRPRPSDAYGGGAVEQNVDAMAYIHRPDMFVLQQKPLPERGADALAKWAEECERVKGLAEIMTGKRRGGAGYRSRELLFDGPSTIFKSRMEKQAKPTISEQDAIDFR